ncbi:MAG: DUF2079 domain-containing protein [Actinomycetota bacterium]|nr:DUF2079 domain-containing protein [Actinomycetota bacterium]
MVLPFPVRASTPGEERRPGWRDPVRWALAVMIGGWSATFFVLGWQRHHRFGTFGFDLGIYDQALWLLSRFETPFITLRGLNFWGHHVNVIGVVLVPFYWLGAGPAFLLAVQLASQAVGAVAVFLLARDRLRARWPAVALAGVLLLHPTYQFLAWEFFHFDALALGPLLLAYWAARARRWRWFAVAAVLAVACKEDVALAMVVLGILIALRGDRRIGAAVSGLAAVWWVVATRLVIPAANGIGPFYDTFFSEFGSSAGDVVVDVATDPVKAGRVALGPSRLAYYRMMFAPVAFLPVFALPTLAVALPMLAVNALSSFPYTREIRYHYSALVLAGVILATVEAIAFLGRTPSRRAFLVGLVAATSLASTVAWGPSPISTKYHTGLWVGRGDPSLAAKKGAVDLVPARASASVSFEFAPHMTHRQKIYEWPVPWRNLNWGVRGENLDDPGGVDWLVIDRLLLTSEDAELLDRLLAREFTVVSERQSIVVARRIRPPA